MATIDGDKKKLTKTGEQIEQAVADIANHKDDTTKHITAAERTAWNGNGTSISALQTAVAGKVDKVTGKGLSTEDYTTADKQKLAGLVNYDDTTVQANISALQSGKVDKVSGKGLSTNDYTTAEKQKLAGLSNYDDTEVRGLIAQKAAASDLTAETAAREAADTVQNAVLADLIDGKAKNMLDLSQITQQTINGITWTVDVANGTITANGTASANSFFYIWPVNTNTPIEYPTVLSGSPADGSTTAHELQAAIGSTVYHDYGSGVEIPAGTIRYVTCCVRSGNTVSDLVFRPMLCSKAAYGISEAFVTYHPTISEMWAAIRALQGGGGA